MKNIFNHLATNVTNSNFPVFCEKCFDFDVLITCYFYTAAENLEGSRASHKGSESQH